jgi:hypothetical protein
MVVCSKGEPPQEKSKTFVENEGFFIYGGSKLLWQLKNLK